MSGFSLAALKNTLDEVRVQVYAKNETEKKVRLYLINIATASLNYHHLVMIICIFRCMKRYLQKIGVLLPLC
jgi:hypothetical protein